jgi:4-amino-4-deoxy-L-arabinose transferase-like glycosyltransferase
MEYGILFFLEMALLYYGFKKEKKWALLILPVLILFTRIDTAIFLGIVFLIDTFWNRKIKWSYVFGGILGVSIALAFNWFYLENWSTIQSLPKTL